MMNFQIGKRAGWAVLGCLLGLMTAADVAIAADDDVEEKEATALIQWLDADGDGKVSDAEALRGAPRLLREANAKKKSARGRQILAALDANDDGKLDAGELRQAIAKAQGRTNKDRADEDKGRGNKRAKELFDKLDANSDSVVTAAEFKKLPKLLGPFGQFLQGQLPQLFAQFDGNRDKRLTLDEFQSGVGKLMRRFGVGGGDGQDQPSDDDKLRQQIRRQLGALDRDRDGKLSKKEAGRNRKLKTKFRAIDTNLDGFLSLDEVVAYAKANPEKNSLKK